MCDDKSVKSCKCNKRFNDSIGHEIKVLNQVLQRKLIYSAKDKGVDKLRKIQNIRQSVLR